MGIKKGVKQWNILFHLWKRMAMQPCLLQWFWKNANIPIPSEIVLGFAGYLIAQGIFDLHTTMVVGILAGDCRLYLILLDG